MPVIKRDQYKESVDKHIYFATGEDPSGAPGGSDEYIYDILAKRIEDVFPQGASLQEIYYFVTGDLGLSLEETRSVIKRARDAGYIQMGR